MAKTTNTEIFSKTLTNILVTKNLEELEELSTCQDALTPFIVCRMLSYRTELATDESYYNMLSNLALSGLNSKTVNTLLVKCLPKTRTGFCKKW
jgi:hypothetical protein